MSEKKENIKSGLNINVDDGNITVLNDISVAEKVKEEVTPEVTSEVKEKPIVPDVKITPDVSIVNTPDIPLPEVPIANTSPDFVIPTINTPTITPVVENNVQNTVPMMQAVPEEKKEPTPIVPNSFNTFNQNPINNNFSNIQNLNNSYDKTLDGENKIFKSTSDVEKLSKEVADEVINALNTHVVYPMKATTDLLNELYEWGENVANNGLNRKLLEEYDELKQKYSDLESVCTGEKTASDINLNNNFNGFDNTSNTKSSDDYNDFGGFGGFGRVA